MTVVVVAGLGLLVAGAGIGAGLVSYLLGRWFYGSGRPPGVTQIRMDLHRLRAMHRVHAARSELAVQVGAEALRGVADLRRLGETLGERSPSSGPALAMLMENHVERVARLMREELN